MSMWKGRLAIARVGGDRYRILGVDADPNPQIQQAIADFRTKWREKALPLLQSGKGIPVSFVSQTCLALLTLYGELSIVQKHLLIDPRVIVSEAMLNGITEDIRQSSTLASFLIEKTNATLMAAVAAHRASRDPSKDLATSKATMMVPFEGPDRFDSIVTQTMEEVTAAMGRLQAFSIALVELWGPFGASVAGWILKISKFVDKVTPSTDDILKWLKIAAGVTIAAAGVAVVSSLSNLSRRRESRPT